MGRLQQGKVKEMGKAKSTKVKVFKAGGQWHVELKRGKAKETYHANSKKAAASLAKKLRQLNE